MISFQFYGRWLKDSVGGVPLYSTSSLLKRLSIAPKEVV